MKKYVFAIVCLLSLVSFCNPVKSSVSLRNNLLDQEDSIIPSKYKVVYCIGTKYRQYSYIETGIFNDRSWHLKTTAIIIRQISNNMYPLFGAWYSDSNWTGYGFIRYGDGINNSAGGRVVYGDYWCRNHSIQFAMGNICNIDFYCEEGSCTLIINETYSYVAFNSSIALNGNQIYLFAFSPSYCYNSADALGEVIIEQNGKVVADLVPCIRLNDNEPVFYDIIQKIERHDLSGTGKLIAYEY